MYEDVGDDDDRFYGCGYVVIKFVFNLVEVEEGYNIFNGYRGIEEI